MTALASDLSSRNGWLAAEHAGDRSPDATQRPAEPTDGVSAP
jgi:hypothetical protein